MRFYKIVFFLFCFIFYSQITQAQWKSQRFAGIGLKEGQPALQVPLYKARGLYVNSSGNVMYGESENYRVRELDVSSGVINTIVGSGQREGVNTGNPSNPLGPLNRGISFVTEVEQDANGNLFIASERIYRVDAATKNITEHKVLVSTQEKAPDDLVIAPNGDLYLVNRFDNIVMKFDTVSKVTTVIAGTGSAGVSPDGLDALSTSFSGIAHIALAANGDIYIADQVENKIRKIKASDNTVETVAGTGTAGFSGDGGQATSAQLSQPYDMVFDSSGDLIFIDRGNFCIRKIEISSGVITTIAGTPGSSGDVTDGATATATNFAECNSLALSSTGELYVLDEVNGKIHKINTSGIINHIAGSGKRFYGGDGAKAVDAQLGLPFGVAVGPDGKVYITDSRNNRIRVVDGDGNISTFAGTGITGNDGDGGLATAAKTGGAFGITIHEATNSLYFTTTEGHYVRKIDLSTNIITTIAGSGTDGFDGDGGQATSAKFQLPSGLAVDASGNVYIADRDNYRVRKVDAATGIVTTIAGDGTRNNTGDGGQATAAGLLGPRDLLIDKNGNLLIACQGQIRSLNLGTGIISTIAGSGNTGYSGDGGPATSAELSDVIYGLTQDDTGAIYFVDQFNFRIRKIDANGDISTIAGSNLPGDSDGSGDALQMQISAAAGLSFKNGIMIAADPYNNTIWKLIESPPTAPTFNTLTLDRDNTTGVKTATLSWTDNSFSEDSFSIERSVGNNSSYQALATLSANTTQYVDSTISVNTTYFYRIKATNQAGETTSTEKNGTINYTPPVAPTLDSLIFSRDTLSNKMATVKWSDLSSIETGFVLERSVNGTTNFVVTATIPANTTQYIDTVKYDTLYVYRVKAIDFEESSAYSNTKDTTFIYVPPQQPSSIGATANDKQASQKTTEASNLISLSWSDNANDEDGYKIQRSTTNDVNTFAELVSLPSNSTGYDDFDIELNTQYYYRIQAFNSDGASPFSNIFSFVLVGTRDAQLGTQTIAYPNPTVNRIQVKIENNYQGSVQATLTSLQGGVFTTIQWNKQSYQLEKSLDVSQLPAGNYLLKIATDKGYTVKQIVKR